MKKKNALILHDFKSKHFECSSSIIISQAWLNSNTHTYIHIRTHIHTRACMYAHPVRIKLISNHKYRCKNKKKNTHTTHSMSSEGNPASHRPGRMM